MVLLANYFKLVTPPELPLFRYKISVLPDEKGKTPVGKKLKRIVEVLLEELFSPGRKDIATDYKAYFFCKSAFIPQDEHYCVRYRSEGEGEASPRARSYRIRVEAAGTLSLSQLMQYITSSAAKPLFESRDDVIQALNIVLGHYPKSVSNIVSIGANQHFDSAPTRADSYNLGAGLTATRGLFVSVRAATSRLLVNVQVKHAAFYAAVPLVDLILAYNTSDKDKLGNFLKKLRIQVKSVVKEDKGAEGPRVKTITYLATPQDGVGTKHPPRVPRVGANAEQVKFFLDSSAVAGDSPAPKEGSATLKEGYISVFEYFLRSKDMYPLLYTIC